MLMKIVDKTRIEYHELGSLFPSTSFPAYLSESDLAEFGMATLHYPPQPTAPQGQKVIDNGHALTNGTWQVQWAVVDKDASELEQDALMVRNAAKQVRQEQVKAIQVTTTAGNTFDGDEESQSRMTRAIIALSTGLTPSVIWVLADNTTIQATAAELTEALVLAGQAQAAVWVL